MMVLRRGGQFAKSRIRFYLWTSCGLLALAITAIAISHSFRQPAFGFFAVAAIVILFKASIRHWARWFLGRKGESAVTETLKSLPDDYAQTNNQQYLLFPLYVGKSWTTDHLFRPRRRDVDRLVNSATKVTDFELITVGFGSFPAFKIRRDTRFRHIDHWVFTYFWSPKTRSVVKYSMEVLDGAAAGTKRQIELINYGSSN